VTVFCVGARQAGTRIDQYLKERIPAMSRRRVQDAIATRVVLLRAAVARRWGAGDGQPTLCFALEALPEWLRRQRPEPERCPRTAAPVREGDRVIVWPEEVEEADEGWLVPVLYEDCHLAAVHKPAGLVVHAN
jgi:23S rRNA-/tRNA-specific pseudouridylate synthase